MSLLTTASQTVGPYVYIGLNDLVIADMAPPNVAGERVSVRGRIQDGDGKAVNDGIVEVWQADADGVYPSPVDSRHAGRSSAFKGFGRVLADATGGFQFTTIKPGRVPGPEGRLQAPHLLITIFMRGLLKQLMTRVYFPDDPANAEDAILQMVPAERRAGLIARGVAGDKANLEWNVALQGDAETVFFDY